VDVEVSHTKGPKFRVLQGRVLADKTWILGGVNSRKFEKIRTLIICTLTVIDHWSVARHFLNTSISRCLSVVRYGD